MSTICKLDRDVRIDRAWRRFTIRRLHNTAALLTGNKALVIGMLAHSLDARRKASHVAGWSKQLSFYNRVPKEI